jgi:hypothetical protein
MSPDSTRDATRRDPRNLPIVLAGRAGGALKTGRHVAYRKQTPLCNLYTAMLECVGAPVDHFGDSTEKLPGLGDADFAGNA